MRRANVQRLDRIARSTTVPFLRNHTTTDHLQSSPHASNDDDMSVLMKQRRAEPLYTDRTGATTARHDEWAMKEAAALNYRYRSQASQKLSADDAPPSGPESAGAAQVRAARAASASAAASVGTHAQSPFLPLALPARAHAHPHQENVVCANGAIKSMLPSKVEVIIDEIITDTSVKRINSAGVTVFKQYKRGRYLGKGGFARCYELQSLDSLKVYAGKIIPKASITKPSAKKKLIAEIAIHKKIHHTNVVKFERFFEGEQSTREQ
jgi:hypothetical protein